MKLVLDSLDEIGRLTVKDVKSAFSHSRKGDRITIDNCQKSTNNRSFFLLIPNPQDIRKCFELSGKIVKGVKIRVNFTKTMTKCRKGLINIDDDEFTLIPVISGAIKMIIFNVNPKTTESDLEDMIEDRAQTNVYQTFFSRKPNNKPTTAFIFVDHYHVEKIFHEFHQFKVHGHEWIVSYFCPKPEDFCNMVQFPRDYEGPICKLVVTGLPEASMDWIILEKFRLFEDVKGYLVSEGGPDPKKEGKKLKNVAVFMKQKGAEVCARYLNKTYFYGKRTEASVYFPDSGEFDGLVPDEASKSALEIVIPKNPSEMEPWCEHVKDLGAHVNRGKGGEIARDGYDGFGSFGGNNNNSNFGMMNQNAAYQQQIMSMQMQIQQMQQNMMNNPMTQIPSSIKQDPTFGAIPALPPNATYSQLASIQKILEKVHGYEEYLINNYHDNATTLPEQIPPASYMVLLKRRAQCKAMMAKLEQQGQNKNKGPGSMAAINNAWANNTATWGPKRKKNNWQN